MTCPQIRAPRGRGTRGRHRDLTDVVRARPQVLESLRTTGDDCYLLRLAVRDMAELAEVVDDLGRFGTTSTNLVYRENLPRRGPTAPAGGPGR